MSRARNIKPGFFRNDLLGELEPLARLLFIALWTYADREGRLQDRPKKIRGELLPYDNVDADPLLQSLHDSGFIVRYEVDGSKYIEIVNFKKHQNPHLKEIKSIIPPRHSDSSDTTSIQGSSTSDANLVQESDDSEDCTEQEVDLSDTSFELIPDKTGTSTELALDKTGTSTELIPDKTGTSTELAPDKTSTSTKTALNHPGLIPLILDSLIPSTNVEIYIPQKIEEERKIDFNGLFEKYDFDMERLLESDEWVQYQKQNAQAASTKSQTEADSAQRIEPLQNDSQKSCKKNNHGDSEQFETFWTVYPRRVEKGSALKAWNARIREKVKPEDLIQAARNYSDDCNRTKREMQFIKHPSKFIGTSRAYLDYLNGGENDAAIGTGPEGQRNIEPNSKFQYDYDKLLFHGDTGDSDKPVDF